MRGLFVAVSILGVMALAVWAYRENYRTQEATRDVVALRGDIAALHERLVLLNAEWAYLNRPDRLAALADLNFDRLALMPIAPEQFGLLEQVAFPPDPATLMVRDIIETRGRRGPAEGEDTP